MEQKVGKTKNLKSFLIQWFVLALAFILITEALIDLFFSNVAFPFFNQFFDANIFASQNPSDSLLVILKGLGWMILSGITTFVPFRFAAPLQGWAQQLAQQDLSSLIGNQIGGSKTWTIISITTLFVVFLFIYLLPYILATLFYSRRIIQEVRRLREEDAAKQEEFNRSRNLLLSDIAHDLKTPITTISGYAQALNSDMVDTPQKRAEYLSAISSKSIQLSNLITLLFDYVRLDSEGFELKMEKTNLTELVLELLASQYSDFEEAEMEIDIQIPEKPIYGNVDAVQLNRAITNLLVNAMKHNEKGTNLLVSMREDIDYILIRVADTGVAIEDSIRESMFEPFVLGDQSRSNKGTGLGLSISSRIMELHGGSIFLEQPAASPYTKAFCIKLPRMVEKSEY